MKNAKYFRISSGDKAPVIAWGTEDEAKAYCRAVNYMRAPRDCIHFDEFQEDEGDDLCRLGQVADVIDLLIAVKPLQFA
jgi:hypothetical protein